jgi:hypothetical protein
MVDQIITIIGWTSRTLKNITFYQCPDCNSCQEMLFGNGDGFFECFRCDSKFAVEEFVEVKRKRTVVICAGCGREVQLVSPTFGCAGLGFICSGCSNYVAVMYGNHFVNPSMVLDLCWNSSVCERWWVFVPRRSIVRTLRDHERFLSAEGLASNRQKRRQSVPLRPSERTSRGSLVKFAETKVPGISRVDGRGICDTSSNLYR